VVIQPVELKKISPQEFRKMIVSPEIMKMFFDMSVVLVGPVLVGVWVGSYLDKHWQSTPWGVFSLTIFGFFVSIALVIKQIKRFSAEDEKGHNTTDYKQ